MFSVKFIALKVYIRKEGSLRVSYTGFHLKSLEKDHVKLKVSRRKGITIRVEIKKKKLDEQ